MSPVTPTISGGLGPPRPRGEVIHKGILATPDQFGGYARLAAAYRARGRADCAGRALLRAMRIAPGEARLLVNAANLWLTTGISGDPSRALRRALCLDPNLSAAIERLLLIRKASGDVSGAVRVAGWLVGRGLAGRAASLLELAVLANETGDGQRAGQLLHEAFRATVGSTFASGDLIRAARRIAGEAARLRVIRGLLCVAPIDPDAAMELARTPDLDEIAELERTKRILTRLCLALPLDAVVQNGAGVAHEGIGRDEGALKCYQRAVILDPGFSTAIFNVGVRARYAGRFDQARGWFRRALTIAPRDPIYRYNLGHVLLAMGRSTEGLALHEERWRSGRGRSHRSAAPEPSFEQPLWDDSALAGDFVARDACARSEGRDSLLIWGEQGLGDEIWFAGYAPSLFADYPTVLECDPRLVALFSRSGLAASVVPRTDPPHAAARRAGWQIAAGSLPLLAERRSPGAATPAPRGYLTVDGGRAASFRARLAARGDGPTIGVSWRSRKPIPSQSFEAALALWRPLFEIENAVFVNLQYDATPSELRRIQEQFGVRLASFEDFNPFHDLDGLAAMVSILDHVVSIANVNVTLCHGLGRSCHVALRYYQEDWRFRRERSVSPWLPDCHLYWPNGSTDPLTDWKTVFSRIADKIGS